MNELRLLPLRFLGALALCLALSHCATQPSAPAQDAKSGPRAEALAVGIAAYQDGRFTEAIRNLRLAQDQGLSKTDRIRAGKYLAFSYCVSGNETACREEFRKLLELNPSFELEPAEAGHPQWGPVFRGLKSAAGKAKK